MRLSFETPITGDKTFVAEAYWTTLSPGFDVSSQRKVNIEGITWDLHLEMDSEVFSAIIFFREREENASLTSSLKEQNQSTIYILENKSEMCIHSYVDVKKRLSIYRLEKKIKRSVLYIFNRGGYWNMTGFQRQKALRQNVFIWLSHMRFYRKFDLSPIERIILSSVCRLITLKTVPFTYLCYFALAIVA